MSPLQILMQVVSAALLVALARLQVALARSVYTNS
jgi:hypothetical protein